jgi:chromosome segregation ATPase
MASEQILRRAVFGGFKREDVIDYIEKLQIQLSEAQQTAGSTKKESVKNTDACVVLKKTVKEKDSAIDSLKSEIEKLNGEIDCNQNTIHLLSVEISSKQSILDSIKSSCEEFEQNREVINKLFNSDAVKESDIYIDALNSLINCFESVFSNFEKEPEDEDQFKFDYDGLEKVEEEYLNKMFITE